MEQPHWFIVDIRHFVYSCTHISMRTGKVGVHCKEHSINSGKLKLRDFKLNEFKIWRCLTGTRVLQSLRKIICQDSWTSWSLVPEYRLYIEKRLELGWENIYGTPRKMETIKAIHLPHREILLVRHFCCLQINYVFRKTWSVLTVNFCIWATLSLYNLESLKEI